MFSLGGNASSGVVSVVRSNRCLSSLSTSGGGSTVWSLTSSTNANGIDLNVVDGNCNVDVHVLLLKFDTINVSVNSFDSPTSTGNDSQTGPNFKPQAVILGLSDNTAVDTVTAANVAGHGISGFTGDSEFCNSWSDEDAADPTNTQSLSDNTAVNLADDDGTNLHTASFTSMDSTGFTLNYSAASGTALKWFYGAFQESSGLVILRRRRELIGAF
jgi:hypothetical protein